MKFADFLLINTKKETAPAPTGTVNWGSTRQCALVTPKRSIMHALNIPDQYIMKRGGWKSDKVLKKVYRGTIESEEKKFTDKINEHFTQIMQHDMQHEPKKA